MRFIRQYLWLHFLALGIAGFLFVWLALPHEPSIEKLWHLYVKLGTYGCILGFIAFFPNHLRYGYLLVYLPFLVFLGYLIPRVSYFGVTGNVLATNYATVGEFYTLLYLLVVQMINFTVAFAYRMGGGTPGNTVKISLLATITLFSGFLDIAFYTINPVAVPEGGLIYAHHITVFLGSPASYQEAILFALGHIPLFLLVLFAPLDKWFGAIGRRFGKDDGKEQPKLAAAQ